MFFRKCHVFCVPDPFKRDKIKICFIYPFNLYEIIVYLYKNLKKFLSGKPLSTEIKIKYMETKTVRLNAVIISDHLDRFK